MKVGAVGGFRRACFTFFLSKIVEHLKAISEDFMILFTRDGHFAEKVIFRLFQLRQHSINFICRLILFSIQFSDDFIATAFMSPIDTNCD